MEERTAARKGFDFFEKKRSAVCKKEVDGVRELRAPVK